MSTRRNTNKIKSIRERSEKIINENKNIKDLEKRYLKGEKHKEISEIPEKEIKLEKEEEVSNQNNNTNNKIESKSNQLLKEKLSNIDINIKALNGINKSMEKQIKYIEKDILENQILITEPKRIISIKPRKTEKITNFEEKSKLKTIKELSESRNYLNSKLQKILLNEKYLQNEGNIENLNLSEKYVSQDEQNKYENKKLLLVNKKDQ